MPPRTRTLTPTASTTRRPRVAGMRDPRRQQDDTVEPGTDVEGTEAGSARTATALVDGPARPGAETDHAAGADADTLTAPAEESTHEADAPGRTVEPPPAPRTGKTKADKADKAPRGPKADEAAKAGGAARTGRATESVGEPGRLRRLATTAAGPFRRLGRSRVGLPVTLAVVVVVCGLLAGLAAWSGHRAWTDGPVANSAVTDVGGTAELVGQAREGVEKVFSYDFAKLDDSPAAAREFGTAEFPSQYQQVFDQTIRPQAVPQQLRQTATVLNLGVRSINGDTARVMALVQFHAERATTKQSTDAPGLLALDMQRVDGRWKLAKLTPLTAQP